MDDALQDALDPAARDAPRLGVLGGSFDPPHRGHLHLCRTARRAAGLDHVVFVPAARSPYKTQEVRASAEERVAMLELALAGEQDVSVWCWELLRAAPSYTVETLRELARRRGEGAPRPFLLMGSDHLAGLAGWRGIDEVLRLARPLVVVRPDEGDSGPDWEELEARLGADAVRALREDLVEAPPDEASSTAVRGALQEGAEADALPAAVRDYVLRRGLYADGSGG